MAHDPHPAHLTRRHLLQLLGAGAGIGLLPGGAAALAQSGRGAAAARVEDWPEVGGKGRLNVWNETGILDTFPQDGLKVLWRTPVRSGYAGPAVANGRVFLLDWQVTKLPFGTERALALDEKTGKLLWTQEWQADYRGISWPTVRARRRPSTAIASTSLGADGKLFVPRREERRDPLEEGLRRRTTAPTGASGRSTGDSPARRSSTATG